LSLGIYVSVPFCKTKCSYCNFASGVFSKQVFKRYVDRLVEDIRLAYQARPEMQIPRFARDDKSFAHGDTGFARDGKVFARGDKLRPEDDEAESMVEIDRWVDSIYLGGGTPTLLEPAQLERLFAALREHFEVASDAEVTVECAPGTLSPEVIESLLRCGVNRVSLGVQSFVDKEASSVARLHTRAVTLEEIARLRAAGIGNINIDLIAGLPHQTRESWEDSIAQLIDTGVPHASVYMLEVDEDSRLGRELIAGGTKYHAHFVPDDDLIADLYERVCERLNAAGLSQYEISNFARAGFESVHNLKYWRRQPYLGFGVDAHSMLSASSSGDEPFGDKSSGDELECLRFATTDNLEQFISGAAVEMSAVDPVQAIEEAFFLGLRLNRGVDLDEVGARYGSNAAALFRDELGELEFDGLIEREATRVRLTARGRLLSNEVFARFISERTAIREI
jgi:oxygen-independent coproporphyrinogen-3 oxidase